MIWVTATTLTLSFIGQPQRITVPRNAISYLQAEGVTSGRH
jgi:hypothetical protein